MRSWDKRIVAVAFAVWAGGVYADSALARPGRRAAATVATATFQGFRARGAGSELYLQFDRMPSGSAEMIHKGKKVTLTVPHARTIKRFRYLDTRYFATPVKLVKTQRRRNNLVVTIDLKENVAPTLDTAANAEGALITLRFPLGAKATEAPPRPRGPLPSGSPGSNDDEWPASDVDNDDVP
mgnify:CR=1 FL=1